MGEGGETYFSERIGQKANRHRDSTTVGKDNDRAFVVFYGTTELGNINNIVSDFAVFKVWIAARSKMRKVSITAGEWGTQGG